MKDRGLYLAIISHLMDESGLRVVNIDTRRVRTAVVQVHFNDDHEVTVIRGEPGQLHAMSEDSKPS